jgi:tetratricopeptide (TPR) repeat protein
MKSNDLKNAFDDFSDAIRINPTHFGAFQNRAIVRGNMEDYAGVLEDLNAAIALNPGFAATYYLRGIAQFELGGDGCNDLKKHCQWGIVMRQGRSNTIAFRFELRALRKETMAPGENYRCPSLMEFKIQFSEIQKGLPE